MAPRSKRDTLAFQSAPLTEARGDAPNLIRSDEVPGVSIRSPHRSEGRSVRDTKPARRRFVSIRSPHRSEGRYFLARFAGALLIVSIRSPHRSEGRSIAGILEAPGSPCFNPLPSPKRGEIQGFAVFQMVLDVSIRSPHRSEGRFRRPAPSPTLRGCFNPLPSPKRGEISGDAAPVHHPTQGFNPLPSPKRGEISNTASRTSPAAPVKTKFQSAPLTEARGDSRIRAATGSTGCFNPLPSPKRGEIRRDRCRLPHPPSFNPLPSPKRGEMDRIRQLATEITVSIRSPHRSEGRFVRERS